MPTAPVEGDEQPDPSTSQICMECWITCTAYFLACHKQNNLPHWPINQTVKHVRKVAVHVLNIFGGCHKQNSLSL